MPEEAGEWNPSSMDSAITTAAMPDRDHQGARAGLGACRPIGLSGGWFKKVPKARASPAGRYGTF